MSTPDFPREHADHIVASVNAAAIRARKFKAVADMINGSACVMDPYLFEQLGVELVPINNTPNGQFAHRPEPLAENLADTMARARAAGADIGFVHDPDADRVVILDERGEMISEEYSLALGVENVLSKHPGEPIVINLSTSQAAADIAAKYGSPCFRSKVGEGYVVDAILKHKAVIGGEGNGGVIYPRVNTVRDGFTTLALVLELLAERGQTVSEAVAALPKYFMKKDKWPASGDPAALYARLIRRFPDAAENREDGLRLDFPDRSWLHLRPSNTEPIIRLFGEARTPEAIARLFEEARLTLDEK